MARAWSQSPASLDSVFAVLSAHDHPFVMVGKYALRWMGVPVDTGYTVDILVRTSQEASIYQAFVKTGQWLEVDESSMPAFDMGGDLVEYRSVRRLKRYDDKWYISLCDEDTYRLTVDTEKVQVPHVVNYNSALVESEFHPNTSDRSVRPYLISDENVKFVGDEPITFPVHIPTIPELLDSCLNCIGGKRSLDDESCILPQIDMDHLAQYLALDSPHQQDKLLAKVKNRKQLEEYFTERQRRQERRMKRIMERRAKSATDSNLGPEAPFVMLPL